MSCAAVQSVDDILVRRSRIVAAATAELQMVMILTTLRERRPCSSLLQFYVYYDDLRRVAEELTAAADLCCTNTFQ